MYNLHGDNNIIVLSVNKKNSLSGAVGTIKAVISEVSDNSNQAFGVAIVGLSWGAGIILGPAVSGAISDPIGQYNLTIESKAICNWQ